MTDEQMTAREKAVLIERARNMVRSGGPHEWGYRDLADGTFIADPFPFQAAQVLAGMTPEPAQPAESPNDRITILACIDVLRGNFAFTGWRGPEACKQHKADIAALEGMLTEPITQRPESLETKAIRILSECHDRSVPGEYHHADLLLEGHHTRVSSRVAVKAMLAFAATDQAEEIDVLDWLNDCDNLILFNGTQADGWWEVRQSSVKGEVRGRGPTPKGALRAAMSANHGTTATAAVSTAHERRNDHLGWRIDYSPPPIPCRDFDYVATHPDFEGEGDTRQVRSGTIIGVIAEIDSWYEENEA